MTSQERDELIEILKSYNDFDIIAEIVKNNPDTNLEALFVMGFPIQKLISQTKKAIVQIEKELLTDKYMYLPVTSNNDPALGNEFDLRKNLHNIKGNLVANNLDGFYGSLSNQIRYQILWGFWDRSTSKIHEPNTEQINEATEGIKLAKKEVERLQRVLNEKITLVESKTNELHSFIELKQRELEFIGTKREEINNIVSDSNQALININELKSQADGSKNLANEHKEEIKRTLEEVKTSISNHEREISEIKTQFKADIKYEIEAFEEKQGEIDKHIKDLEDTDSKYKLALGEITNDNDFISTKREEIIKLTGFAADSVLAHSFDKRAKEIEKGVILWRFISGGIILLTVVWILCLMTSFFTDFKIEARWDSFLVNFLKTSPFFVGLGFALTQYARERSLWEEYAFKAAVALTINPYADKLDGTDGNDLKKQLIVSSIMNVYSKPKGMYEKGSYPTEDGIKTILNSVKRGGNE